MSLKTLTTTFLIKEGRFGRVAGGVSFDEEGFV